MMPNRFIRLALAGLGITGWNKREDGRPLPPLPHKEFERPTPCSQILSRKVIKEPSLKHKIGQMLMVGFGGSELKLKDPIVQAILKQEIGGVILFDYDPKTNSYN